MELYFYDDLYCDGLAIQGGGLEFPRLHGLNRFFIKAMSDWFYYMDVTCASIRFNDDAQPVNPFFPLPFRLLGSVRGRG